MTTKPLPSDPEGRNDDRAEWAAIALDAFRDKTQTDPVDVVADLICGIMHWCDRNGINFDVEFGRAREFYAEETAAPNGLRRMILNEAAGQYAAYRNMRAATEAERTLANLKLSECQAMLDELAAREGK
jgi:hypothetical protein